MEPLIIAFRLLITFVFSFLFGIERQLSHKSVSFGTFIFVCTSACTIAMGALVINPDNPMPLLAAVITGIGFLGAGALIKTTDRIFGFTTAAAIWVVAAFGMMIGIGQYVLGFFLYILMMVVIVFDHLLEEKGLGIYQRKIIVKTNDLIHEDEVAKLFKSIGIKRFRLITICVERAEHKQTIVYLVEGRKKSIKRISNSFIARPWLASIHLE